MSLIQRTLESPILSTVEKAILILLAGRPHQSTAITEALQGDSRNFAEEVAIALDSLNKKGLIRIKRIGLNRKTKGIFIELTYAEDWVFKL